MTKEEFRKQFIQGKQFLPPDEAVGYIHSLLVNEFPMLQKTGYLNRLEYIRRLAQRTACMEIIQAIRGHSPWEDRIADYREVIAMFEWGYMRRVGSHSLYDVWSGPDGKKRGEADAWFIEMWRAYYDVYLRMPGNLPDTTAWRMYDNLMIHILHKTVKYRRNLPHGNL